jgi:hypothetical protein
VTNAIDLQSDKAAPTALPVEASPTRLETASRLIVLEECGMLRSSYKRATDNTLAEAQAVVRLMAVLARGIRRPVLVDFRGMRSMDREARAYFAGPETAAVIVAAAILTDSSLQAAIGSFFTSVKVQLVPMQLFTSEPHAVAWLKTYLP